MCEGDSHTEPSIDSLSEPNFTESLAIDHLLRAQYVLARYQGEFALCEHLDSKESLSTKTVHVQPCIRMRQ